MYEELMNSHYSCASDRPDETDTQSGPILDRLRARFVNLVASCTSDRKMWSRSPRCGVPQSANIVAKQVQVQRLVQRPNPAGRYSGSSGSTSDSSGTERFVGAIREEEIDWILHSHRSPKLGSSCGKEVKRGRPQHRSVNGGEVRGFEGQKHRPAPVIHSKAIVNERVLNVAQDNRTVPGRNGDLNVWDVDFEHRLSSFSAHESQFRAVIDSKKHPHFVSHTAVLLEGSHRRVDEKEIRQISMCTKQRDGRVELLDRHRESRRRPSVEREDHLLDSPTSKPFIDASIRKTARNGHFQPAVFDELAISHDDSSKQSENIESPQKSRHRSLKCLRPFKSRRRCSSADRAIMLPSKPTRRDPLPPTPQELRGLGRRRHNSDPHLCGFAVSHAQTSSSSNSDHSTDVRVPILVDASTFKTFSSVNGSQERRRSVSGAIENHFVETKSLQFHPFLPLQNPKPDQTGQYENVTRSFSESHSSSIHDYDGHFDIRPHQVRRKRFVHFHSPVVDNYTPDQKLLQGTCAIDSSEDKVERPNHRQRNHRLRHCYTNKKMGNRSHSAHHWNRSSCANRVGGFPVQQTVLQTGESLNNQDFLRGRHPVSGSAAFPHPAELRRSSSDQDLFNPVGIGGTKDTQHASPFFQGSGQFDGQRLNAGHSRENLYSLLAQDQRRSFRESLELEHLLQQLNLSQNVAATGRM